MLFRSYINVKTGDIETISLTEIVEVKNEEYSEIQSLDLNLTFEELRPKQQRNIEINYNDEFK